ncbi:hypothetical protein ANCDUO_15840 [Ancylostoma duodenale]|uniref:Uncharacterized protein n=1 Tax=Ancylostoma duodenale TaxID=51022 RepID=A0A0C2FZI1_9BILA|nr:hypothetical protein ANCDUO_15840 [Ancylostoma duodenale]
MLAARGVSLGLGKINLSDLHQLPSEKHRASQLKREDKARVPKIVIKKKADAKDLFVLAVCIFLASKFSFRPSWSH